MTTRKRREEGPGLGGFSVPFCRQPSGRAGAPGQSNRLAICMPGLPSRGAANRVWVELDECTSDQDSGRWN